ncbi:protein FAM170B isoform X2 [Macrotis lagotis]|uniref:protein FAM170B isoform X2 n=1 Tax=Macrotis lagotis TaxID=92651 RepID=UPI003D69CF9C
MKRHYVDTGNEKDQLYSKAPCHPAEELEDVNWVPFWEQAGDMKEEESAPIPGPSINRAQDADLESKAHNQQARSTTPSAYQSCSQYYSCLSSITNPEEKKSQQNMYAFYTRVQTVQGVAVAWETESGFEPISIRPRVREAEFTQKQRRDSSPLESISTSDLVSETDSWEGDAFQDCEEPETTVPSTIVQELRETPDWLITTNYGLRCLACCRIFPNLEGLLHHAQHGIKEGFSCHIFYREMLQRRQSQGQLLNQPPEDQDQGQSHSSEPIRKIAKLVEERTRGRKKEEQKERKKKPCQDNRQTNYLSATATNEKPLRKKPYVIFKKMDQHRDQEES